MNSIEATITVGAPAAHQNLTIFPLFGSSIDLPAYDTLDRALAQGTVHITEVSDFGSVPEIQVRNGGTRPVLIIDGEELVGAKQNRTVNLSVLVAAAADVIVPVTCVEAGRWNARSRHFTSAPRTHFGSGRAAKSVQVSASLASLGVPRANQAQVWSEIEQRRERLDACSETGAMGDIFDRQANAIECFVRGLPVQDRQVGAVFVLAGEPVGLDVFDHPATFASLAPKILRGYALDAIALQTEGQPDLPSDRTVRQRTRKFVARTLAAPRSHFAIPGLGETWRLSANELAGGGISFGGRIIHVSAFRIRPEAGGAVAH